MKTHITAGLFLIAAALLQSTDVAAQRHRSRNDYAYHRDYRHTYDRDYRYYPRRSSGISVVAALPFGSVMVSIGGRPYHYNQGLFYRPEGYGYMLTPPPIGIIVPSLPQGSLSVMLGGRRGYYYSDTYYMPIDGNRYQVVEAPAAQNNTVDADDDETAANNAYEKIVIDGKTYYKKGSTYYKALVDDNGEIAYEEVGQAGK